jgi:hypothetical protein
VSPLEFIVDRVAADPAFAQRLAEDPRGTVEAEGLTFDQAEVRDFLGVADGGSDEEFAEALQERLSHSCIGPQPAPSPFH